MNTQELKLVCSLASIFALRMLGLCMLLPLFAIEARSFAHATPQLIGIAVGAYGLAQAVLQIPFGAWSDKFGRRPLLVVGLTLLVLGSLVAYFASSIYGLILGRILQGSGAIGSVIIATLADYTREHVRARAMAVLGISIGAAFVVALVLGPWLTQALGLQAVFLVTACLAVASILLLFITIPKTVTRQSEAKVACLGSSWRDLVSNRKFVSLNYGIFALHASLAALFLVLPLLVEQAGFAVDKVWQLYLRTLLVALPVSLTIIWSVEKRQRTAQMQMYAIVALIFALALLQTFNMRSAMFWILSGFFTAFCILEAILPSLVAKYAPQQQRGTAMGVYSSMQFLGVCCGGIVGGWVHSKFGVAAVLQFCMVLAAVWLIINSVFQKHTVLDRGEERWQEV